MSSLKSSCHSLTGVIQGGKPWMSHCPVCFFLPCFYSMHIKDILCCFKLVSSLFLKKKKHSLIACTSLWLCLWVAKCRIQPTLLISKGNSFVAASRGSSNSILFPIWSKNLALDTSNTNTFETNIYISFCCSICSACIMVIRFSTFWIYTPYINPVVCAQS